MITEEQFRNIQTEVTEALDEVFNAIRVAHPDNYILFIADGEYKEKYINTNPPMNPYVINDMMDKYTDETRQRFLVEFMRTFYSFPNGEDRVADSEIRLNMELMIYTHIWEAKPFLKRLHRLAHLSLGEAYNWDVQVPPMGKHDFIRTETRDVLRQSHLRLAGIITNGYHSSLRNAFAHSEYSFERESIYLHNHGGAAWELRDITFDDWSRRFAYSVLLNYHMFNAVASRRRSLQDDFGNNVFAVDHPSRLYGIRRQNIVYHADVDAFNFER